MTRRPQHPYPLNDKQDFAAWRVQHRRAYHLLDTVIFAWRGSNASLRGFAGKWAAYSQDEWMEKSSLSKNAMKLEFFRLELDGLIEREPGSWDGFKPRTFVRPTILAINFMTPRPTDYGRLGQAKRAKTTQTGIAKGHPKTNSQEPPKGQPNGEPHITSLPSHPSYPTNTTVLPAHMHTGGEGKAGEDAKIKKKLILKKQVPKPPIPPAPDDDDMDAAFEAVKAKKRARLLKQFPPWTGAHESFVTHPSIHFGPAWFGWSIEKQTESYGWYLEKVERWYNGKKGKAYNPLSYDEAEFELDLEYPDSEQWMAMSKKEQTDWGGLTKPQQQTVLKKIKAELEK